VQLRIRLHVHFHVFRFEMTLRCLRVLTPGINSPEDAGADHMSGIISD
jgi:hypothetical protein